MTPPSILIVDHDPSFRESCLELLRGSGYRADAVATAEDALKRLAENGRIDVVLADLQLPGVDGLELLRQSFTLDNPPDVIVVTSHASHESAVEALKAGARDYLVKPFKPAELQHLIENCIEQRRLISENSLLKSQLRLYQRGQTIAALLEVDRLLATAVSTLLAELRQGCGLAFLGAEGKVQAIYGAEGLDEAAAAAIARHFLPSFEHLPSLSIQRDLELPATEGWIKSACLIPLRCEQDLKGGIILTNPRHADLPQQLPLDNLLFLAEQTALGFHNAYRYQGARDLIYTDDLTGLYNYRYMQLVLDQEIRRTERYGLSFSVLFIDLDYFKEINDTYGHLVGSQVLRDLARLLKTNVREVDILFRYGGDEFTALLVETDSRGAAIVAERIRKAIEGTEFSLLSGGTVTMTATLGYASYPESAKDKDAIIDLADRAMYEGKKLRNVIRGAWELPRG